jgi:type III pantothenate kinase
MILLDCGNRNLKAQFFDAGLLRASFAITYDSDWWSRLNQWMQGLPAAHCYLASVLDGARQAELEQCLAQQFGTAVTRFESTARTLGVTNGYRQPERLGDDRWMTLLAAREMAAGGCIVIDAGSAITLDLLRADGQHLGGAILPGVNTSIEHFKSIFNYIDFDAPEIAQTLQPGCSTEAAIHIDYAQTTIEILPELVNRWIQLFNDETTILLAGGDAERVQRVLDQPSRIVPDLVFRGIRRLAEQ